MLHCFAYSSLGGWLRCAAKREWSEAKRERGPKRMRLGFPRERAALGFYSERNARVVVGSRRTAEIERASVVAQAGARAHGALPA